MSEFLRRPPRWLHETQNQAINFDIEPETVFEILTVRIHLDAVGGAGNLTIQLDSGEGAVHDVVLAVQDMAAVTDFVWTPTARAVFSADDIVNISWANAGGVTYGIEVIWVPVRDGE